MDLVDIKVLFFAASKEIAGCSESTIKLPKVISFEDLKALICSNFGLHTIANNFVLAVNQDYFESGGVIELSNGDEVAIIPPLSAG